jgi:AraC-like DNA-binding protein
LKHQAYIPGDILKPFIKSFVIDETDGEREYKVLPDTGIVIGFQYRGGLSFLKDGNEIALSKSGITGIRDSYRIFKNPENTGTVLVFFKEAGASAFFKQPLHELFRESVSLDNFMLRSELLCLEEKLCESKNDENKIKVVEDFFISRLSNTEPDKLVLAAISLIHKAKGNIRITELIQHLHISQSPLEKRFRKAVGASPKKFASIIRLKHALQQYHSVNSLTELSYEAGFFDQAHFIKEFKTFTGINPENYFSDKK